MPAWLLAALRMLAGGALLGGGAEVGSALVGPSFGVPPGLEAQQARSVGFGVTVDPFTGEVLKKRRRRRRRALTASDRADIAFIAGILGPKAGKDIAAIIAART